MSKFTDRLKRLHESRVRALDGEEERQQKGVFHAEETTPSPRSESSPPRSDSPKKPDTPREPVDDTPARKAVRDQLRRGARLESPRTSPAKKRRKLQMRRDPSTNENATSRPEEAPSADLRENRVGERSSAAQSENRVGERLAELRMQAEALIGVGATDAALPMLHEMLALSPDNPYPLGVLVQYWRSRGDETLARLYEGRLRKSAPY